MRYYLPILTFVSVFAFADVVVVTAKNSSIVALSKKELKEIYLKKQQFSNGAKLLPINLPASSHARATFERFVLKMDETDLGEYWNERHYNGVNPPMVQNSQEAVKAMVKKVPGAIGYIDEEMLDEGLRVITTVR